MEPTLQQLVDDARAGGPRSLRAGARLMTAMTDQPQRLAELLGGSRDWPQPRLVLGVTGAPGSGKSTLVDGLAAEYRRRRPDCRLGIVAVDPSSPFTGGALLGDRIRMMRHATDPGVFIRSLASRGRLGGLALGVKGVVRVMGLLGSDVVIVETVGVGQCEVEIAQHADLTMVVLAPGQGDSIQLLKAGLIEAGDLFVVNKADREEAATLHQQLLGVLHLARHAWLAAGHGHHGAPQLCADAAADQYDDRQAEDRPAFLCSAANRSGIDAVVDELAARTERSATQWQARRRRQAADEVREALTHEFVRRLNALLAAPHEVDVRVAQVLAGQASIDELVDQLMRDAADATPPRVVDGALASSRLNANGRPEAAAQQGSPP